MPLVRPPRSDGLRAKMTPSKEMMVDPPRERLIQAANRAQYLRSPYHSTGAPRSGGMDQVTATRKRFASKCDPKWTPDAATEALRIAIGRGWVSTEWQGLFPRYAWHREDDTVY